MFCLIYGLRLNTSTGHFYSTIERCIMIILFVLSVFVTQISGVHGFLVITPYNGAAIVGSSVSFLCETNSTAIHTSSTTWNFFTDCKLTQDKGIIVFTGNIVNKKFSEGYQVTVAVNETSMRSGSVLTIDGVKLNSSGCFKCTDINSREEWSAAELIVLQPNCTVVQRLSNGHQWHLDILCNVFISGQWMPVVHCSTGAGSHQIIRLQRHLKLTQAGNVSYTGTITVMNASRSCADVTCLAYFTGTDRPTYHENSRVSTQPPNNIALWSEQVCRTHSSSTSLASLNRSAVTTGELTPVYSATDMSNSRVSDRSTSQPSSMETAVVAASAAVPLALIVVIVIAIISVILVLFVFFLKRPGTQSIFNASLHRFTRRRNEPRFNEPDIVVGNGGYFRNDNSTQKTDLYAQVVTNLNRDPTKAPTSVATAIYASIDHTARLSIDVE